MIIHREEMRTEELEHMRGGEGTVSMLRLVEPEFMRNVRLINEITLPPGASIGQHQHDNETEYFIIIKGKGTVIDNGVKKNIKTGDVLVTGNGGSHSIINTGTAPLILHAIIITY